MGNLDSKLSQAAHSHHHHSYSIIEESPSSPQSKSTPAVDNLGFRLAPPISTPLWTVKKVNYQNEGKNSLLFEFNQGKFGASVTTATNESNSSKKGGVTINTKYLKLAQNQIKMLKSIRHPNIARYLFAEDNSSGSGGSNSNSSHHHSNLKCILIVESMRSLAAHSGEMSFEQLISGVYGLTNALAFLHDKAAISHNNVNEHSVYLNGKQVWKLSDFELALSFHDLTKENLRQIFEFRHKDSLTPEEVAEFRLNNAQDLDRTYKSHPHAIDSYAWSKLVKHLLMQHWTRHHHHNHHNHHNHHYSSSSNHAHDESSEKRSTTNSTTNIIDESSKTTDELDAEDDYDENEPHNNSVNHRNHNHSVVIESSSPSRSLTTEYEENIQSQLEPFMSKEASKRPTMGMALQLALFELHRFTPTGFDPFRLESLNDVEQNWPQLISYLNEIASHENGKSAANGGSRLLSSSKKSSSSSSTNNNPSKHPCLLLVNEKLIDVLLKPFMFFSERVRSDIFPAILLPKSPAFNKPSVLNIDHMLLQMKEMNKSTTLTDDDGKKKRDDPNVSSSSSRLEPFLDVDKYKAFVLPRILSLFSMRSTQIRIVLLQYFPFYVPFITDQDTLKYEILPELLIGLKDKNNQLVSLTFSCLSIMVLLLGSEVVVGHKSNDNSSNKYFSDNIPKSATADSTLERELSSSKISSRTSFTDEMLKNTKTFSDSMIGLHESANDLLSTNTSKEINHHNEHKHSTSLTTATTVEFSTSEGGDEWLNDFGNWSDTGGENGVKPTAVDTTTTTPSRKIPHRENKNNHLMSDSVSNSSSVVTTVAMPHRPHYYLASSEAITTASSTASFSTAVAAAAANRGPSTISMSSRLQQIQAVGRRENDEDPFGVEFDIKSNRTTRTATRSPDDELLENYLNELAPKIEKTKRVEAYEMEDRKSATVEQNVGKAWDCDEIDLDNI